MQEATATRGRPRVTPGVTPQVVRGLTPARTGAGPFGLPLLAAAVFVLALLGRLSIVGRPTDHALVWPVAGVVVLWLLYRGRQAGPLDVVAVAAPAGLALWLSGTSLLEAVIGGLLVLVQPVVTVALMHRLTPGLAGAPFNPSPDRARLRMQSPGVLARFGVALVAGALATGAALVLVTLPMNSPDAQDLGLWVVRDLCWVLVVLTAGLAVGERRVARAHAAVDGRLHRGSVPELLAVVAVSVLVLLMIYVWEVVPLAYPLLLTTVWLALRFDLLVTTWHTLVFGALGTVLSLLGHGPFAAAGDPVQAALFSQAFVLLLAAVGLVVSAERSQVQRLNAELRRSETVARDQADLFGQMIDAMTEGVMVVDATGEVLASNPAIDRLLGGAAGDRTQRLQGLMGYDLDGNRLTEQQRPSRRALAGERVERELVLYRLPGQPDRVLAATALPLPDLESLGRSRAMILLEDVTVEHERRADLLTFAHMVAHDLRNPLASIRGWTMVMRKKFDDTHTLSHADLLGYLRRTENSAERMDDLIGHLLDRATRDVEPSEEDVDLGYLVGQIAADRGIGDLVEVEDLPELHADVGMLRQLFDNLLANATKFARPGVASRVVVGSRLEDDGVVVTVTDNGVGLPAGQHEAIFHEGHRGHGAAYDGTGLGLAVCRRIATHHGGSIRASDNPAGPGAVLEVRLPLGRVLRAGGALAEGPADQVVTAARFEQEHQQVIDDDRASSA